MLFVGLYVENKNTLLFFCKFQCILDVTNNLFKGRKLLWRETKVILFIYKQRLYR